MTRLASISACCAGLAGCVTDTTSLAPEGSTLADHGHDALGDTDGTDGTVATLQVGGGFSSPSCDAAIVAYEALIDPAVAEPQCRWTFDDGATSDACVGEHELPAGGVHDYTLEVLDLATGAFGSTSGSFFIYEPLLLDVEIEQPACGLSFSFTAEPNQSAFVTAQVSPAEKVVGEPFFLGGDGSVTVTEPGTYTIAFEAEDERTTGPICVERVVRTVEVVACDDHEHDPGCGH